ncbi:MAG: hypothetical protein KDJ90_10670 [Nitratireductor sp.]|nr:hypothetical protein [Nitratireductor sp.]
MKYPAIKYIVTSAVCVLLPAASFAADDLVEPVPYEQAMTGSPVMGEIQGYFGTAILSSDGESAYAHNYGASAKVNFALTPNWNLQGDLFAQNLETSDDIFKTTGGAMHMYWRDPNSYALGAYVSLARYSIGGGANDLTSLLYGPEFQIYSGQYTFYGQGYFGDFRSNDADGKVDMWGARGVVSYYFNDNLKWDNEVIYRHLGDSDDSVESWTGATQITYRIDGSPVSFFGRYEYAAFSGEDVSGRSQKVLAGIRFSLGGTTLREDERYGAAMDIGQVGNQALF